MSEVRDAKLRRLYDEEDTSSRVNTGVIQTMERDVRTVLDHLETEYVGPELSQCCRRLRRWVGYSS